MMKNAVHHNLLHEVFFPGQNENCFKGLHKTFRGTTKKCEKKKFNSIFISVQLSEMNGSLRVNDLHDHVICDISIYADDTILYSKCNQCDQCNFH